MAHVPVVYHVPALIRQPLLAPLVYAWRNPFPLYGDPVAVGIDVAPLEVGVGVVVWYFGK